MKFKHKADWWFNAIMALLCFLPIYLIMSSFLNKNRDFLTSGIILLFIALIIVVPVYFLTEYEIKEGSLNIKSGLFHKKKIPVKNIKTIAPTHHPLSSAVLSSHRIAIYYVKNGAMKNIFLSLADKDGFISALLKENPDMAVKK